MTSIKALLAAVAVFFFASCPALAGSFYDLGGFAQTTSQTTATMTVNANVPIGDYVVVFTGSRNQATATSVHDSQGNCSSVFTGLNSGIASGFGDLKAYYCKVTTALTSGTDTIVATWGSSTSNIVVSAYGVSGESAIDASCPATSASYGTGSASGSASMTGLTGGADVFLAVVNQLAGSVSADGNTGAGGGSINWSAVGTDLTFGGSRLHKVAANAVNANGYTVTYAPTLSTTTSWGIQCVSFKPAGITLPHLLSSTGAGW